MVENPYPFFKPSDKLSEQEDRLLHLSWPAYLYITLDHLITTAPDLKMVEALSETRDSLKARLSPWQRLEVLNYDDFQKQRMLVKNPLERADG